MINLFKTLTNVLRRSSLQQGEISISSVSHRKAKYLAFKEYEEVYAYAKALQGEWAENYKKEIAFLKANKYPHDNKPKVIDAVALYCGNRSNPINRYLGVESREVLPILEEDIISAQNLSEALASAPRINENVVVYRQIETKEFQKIYHLKKHGKDYVYKGFLSTSCTLESNLENVAHRDCLLKIYVPRNTPGIFVDNIAKRAETEFLMAPNMTMHVISRPYRSHHRKTLKIELRAQDL